MESVKTQNRPRSDGKRKRSTALFGGKMKRFTARSGGKRKKSLKDELKEDGPSKRYYVPRFYRSDWYDTGLDFELVEAVKGFSVVRDDRTWNHVNFKAKLKDSQPSFFFGELDKELDNERILQCCILNPNNSSDWDTMCEICNSEGQVLFHPCSGTVSMSFPPASFEIHMEPPVASNMYEYELIKAGGSEEKAKKAYREFLHNTYAVMPGRSQ